MFSTPPMRMASLRVLALPVLMGGVLGWAGAAEKDGAGDEPEDIRGGVAASPGV